jgi:hypothetical protein
MCVSSLLSSRSRGERVEHLLAAGKIELETINKRVFAILQVCSRSSPLLRDFVFIFSFLLPTAARTAQRQGRRRERPQQHPSRTSARQPARPQLLPLYHRRHGCTSQEQQPSTASGQERQEDRRHRPQRENKDGFRGRVSIPHRFLRRDSPRRYQGGRRGQRCRSGLRSGLLRCAPAFLLFVFLSPSY